MKHSCFGIVLSSYLKRQFLSFSYLRVKPTGSRYRSVNHEKVRCYGSTSFSWRTHTCGELRREHVDQKVCLCGWLQFKRSKFVTLRDAYGATQLLVRPTEEESDLAENLEKLALESVIQVTGIVKNRPPGQESRAVATGDIEVLIDNLKILSESSHHHMPFIPRNFQKVNELLRLQHRYIDLRNPELQHNLRLRSNVVMKVREFLCSEGFIDVETPTLFRQTPGGAHEFVVPTAHPDLFYALTQSPQQFKQLLMIGGLDRYFQIARCYRDEQSRPDRQPEFTQIDIEMSFVKPEGIFSLIETMLLHCWPNHLPQVAIPFPKMSYAEAMRNYGVDKPDTRFEIKLQDVPSFLKDRVAIFKSDSTITTDFCVKAIVVPDFSPFFTKSVQNEFLYEAKQNYKAANLAFVRIGADLSWSSSLNKYIDGDIQSKVKEVFDTQPDDVIIFCFGKSKTVHALIGRLRIKAADKLEENGLSIRDQQAQNFLWITDFPLFDQKENGSFESMHHPFTAPHPDDVELVYSDPAKVRALHYDLVLNGAEIGGGSIRIHDSSLQKHVIQDILKEDLSHLTHLTDALESGCPPHGGIALGLDRLIAIMCKASSIRDVIAFPKSLDGKDLMAKAPAKISDTEKKRYHLK